MMSNGYTSIGASPRRPTTESFVAVLAAILSALLLTALSLSTTTGQAVGQAVGTALYTAGSMIESSYDLTSASTTSTLLRTTSGCLCDCDGEPEVQELALNSLGQIPERLYDENDLDESALTPSTVPTTTRDFEIFWTDGSEVNPEDSYVWTTNEFNEGLLATVLLETGVTAMGVSLDNNGTTLYYDGSDCLYHIAHDGTDNTEILCYTGSHNGNMQGLDLYEFGNKIYWVDANDGNLYQTTLHNNDGTYEVLYSGFSAPIGVSVDSRAGKIYVTDSNGLYRLDVAGTDFVTLLDSNSFANYYGIDIDQENRAIYFAADSGIYSAPIADPDSYTLIYGSLNSPKGIAIDFEQNIVFFTDKNGVFRGVTDGSEPAVTIAIVREARFITIIAIAAPTPAPTAIPTEIPTLMPSSLPTSRPSSSPTNVPTSIPTEIPTGSPTFNPTSAPTTVCFNQMLQCGYCDGSVEYACISSEAPTTAAPTTYNLGQVLGLQGRSGKCFEGTRFYLVDGAVDFYGEVGGPDNGYSAIYQLQSNQYVSGVTQYGGCTAYAGGGISYIIRSINDYEATKVVSFNITRVDASVVIYTGSVQWPCQITGLNFTNINGLDTIVGLLTDCSGRTVAI